MNIITIFITGLFAGGLTCVAVQGGLLASSIAQQERESTTVPVISFLVARLTAYTFLGLLLGYFGSVAQLSVGVKIVLQLAVALFMIGTALNLLHVHPIFRYFIIQPPRFLMRLVKNQSKSKSMFGPALLGTFTVFIPCGATQAMMAYAVSTGSPLSGALTMFVFILGTSPLFMLLGYAAKKFGTHTRFNFNKVAAIIILIVALYNLTGVLALSGSPVIFKKFSLAKQELKTPQVKIVTQGTIYFNQTGYTTEPSTIAVKSGSKVQLNLINNNGSGCIQAFTIPSLNIQRVIPVGSSDTVTFVVPKMTGEISFMCSMGMYRGRILVT